MTLREGTLDPKLHGTLVEVLGVGVLLRGPSGIGKSECALELVQRGHKLVADDAVLLRLSPAGDVLGSTPATIRHKLEIRGIGIVDLAELYGADSVRDEWRVDLVCELESWEVGKSYERVGLERPTVCFEGRSLPSLLLPIRAVASLASVVELAVRDYLQRQQSAPAAVRMDLGLAGRGGG